MYISLLKAGLLTGALVFAVGVASPALAYAQETVTEPTRAQAAQAQAAERREAAEAKRVEMQTMAEEKRTEVRANAETRAETRLADKKLKACERREKTIQNIMSRLSDRGSKQLEVFTTISDRTQAFYADSGTTVANYDALVAAVDAKKAAAEAAIQANTEVEFTCDSENPKGAASAFRENLKTQNAALKEYKTSVKDLIVAVKTALETTTPETDTETDTTTEGEQE